MRIITDSLPYTASTDGEYRDLRQITLRIGRTDLRISLNGIHRTSKSQKAETRRWNPGWAIGLDRLFVEYVSWARWPRRYAGRRRPRHLSLNAGKRGITLSLVKRTV